MDGQKTTKKRFLALSTQRLHCQRRPQCAGRHDHHRIRMWEVPELMVAMTKKIRGRFAIARSNLYRLKMLRNPGLHKREHRVSAIDSKTMKCSSVVKDCEGPFGSSERITRESEHQKEGYYD